MNTKGITLTVKLNGSAASANFLDAIESVEVILDDFGRSGFQIASRAARTEQSSDVYDELIALVPQKDQRLVLSVQFDDSPVVIMDGLVLRTSTTYDATGRTASFVTMGEDISVVLDYEEKQKAFATEDESAIVTEILGSYSSFFSAKVVAPSVDITPVQNVYLPIQRATDRAYLESLARRYGHKVYVGFKSPKSELYWGPPVVSGSQPDLIFTGGLIDNVTSLSIEYDAMAATKYFGSVQDRDTNVISDINVETADATAVSVSTSAALTKQARVRKRLSPDLSGRLQTESQAWTQSAVDDSTAAVRVSGELDSVRYGQPLVPRSSVNLRGVSAALDGEYYVRQVTHLISPTRYTQKFVLLREGIDTSG